MHEHLHWGHIRILARSTARNAMRSGSGITFIVFALFGGLGIAATLMEPLRLVSKVGDINNASVLSQAMDVVRPVMSWWIDATGDFDPRVNFLVEARPALLSAILVVFLGFVPFLSVLAGFNQTAGDIGARSLRYLLFRTERINIFLSRLIGAFMFTAIAELLLAISFAFIVLITVKVYGVGDLLLWALHGWLAMLVTTLPYLCLSAWVSAANDSAGVSLVLNLLLVGFVGIFINLTQNAIRGDGDAWLDRLTPAGWRYDLLHPDVGSVLLAVLVMLAFSGLFLWLGARTFRTRDL